MKKALVLVVLPVVLLVAGIVLWREVHVPGRREERAVKGGSLTGATTSASPRWGGDYKTLSAEREILILCGASMRPVAERLAEAFQKEKGIAVRFNFGGSSELLAMMELGPGGDLYLCHDPYAERVSEKGLLERAEAVGWLTPILVVAPGNPKGIRSLEDLARPGVRVGLPDARFATAGKIVRTVLAEKGIEDAVDANLQLESRAHNELGLAVCEGHLDVAVVWNFIGRYYAGKLESVPTGVRFPEIRVTICLLKTARDVEAARLFLEYASMPGARALFAEMGYRREEPPEGE